MAAGLYENVIKCKANDEYALYNWGLALLHGAELVRVCACVADVPRCRPSFSSSDSLTADDDGDDDGRRERRTARGRRWPSSGRVSMCAGARSRPTTTLPPSASRPPPSAWPTSPPFLPPQLPVPYRRVSCRAVCVLCVVCVCVCVVPSDDLICNAHGRSRGDEQAVAVPSGRSAF
jgi:hypothetical protein